MASPVAAIVAIVINLAKYMINQRLKLINKIK